MPLDHLTSPLSFFSVICPFHFQVKKATLGQSEYKTVNIPISAHLIEDHEEKIATHQEHAEYFLVFAVLYGFSGLSTGSTKLLLIS